jgi:hypothetical protein
MELLWPNGVALAQQSDRAKSRGKQTSNIRTKYPGVVFFCLGGTFAATRFSGALSFVGWVPPLAVVAKWLAARAAAAHRVYRALELLSSSHY